MKVFVTLPGKDDDELRCLMKTKGIQNWQWKKVAVNASYDFVTNYRNEDNNCHEYFIFFCYEYIGVCDYKRIIHLFLLFPLSCNIRCINFIS